MGKLAQRHWERYLPEMVKDLKRAGIYYETLIDTQEQAMDALSTLISCQGWKWDQAWEVVTRDLIFLPPEGEKGDDA